MGTCCAAKPARCGLTVEAQSTSIVKAPSVSEELREEGVVKMGVLDCVTAPFMIINLPFLYDHPLNDSLLSTSLASTLAAFPLFAGRVRSSPAGDFEVVLSNGGASLTFASSPCRLEDLLPAGLAAPSGGSGGTSSGTGKSDDAGGGLPAGCIFRPVNLSPLYPPAPPLLLGYLGKDVPLLHAQVTHLQDGATCLAVAIPHLLGDLDTCKSLLSSWAAAYTAGAAGKASAPSAPALTSLGHSVLAPYAAPALPAGYQSSTFELRTWSFIPKIVGGALWHIVASGGVECVAYHIPAARLAELKSEAASGATSSGASSAGWISTNDALVARLWQVLAALPPKRRNRARFFLSLNLRKRLVPALPGSALGNCAWSVALGDGTEDPCDSEGATPAAVAATLGTLAAAVRAAIQGLDRDAISKELRWLEEHQGKGTLIPTVIQGTLGMLPPGGNVVISNWDWDKGYSSVAFGGTARGVVQIAAAAGPAAAAAVAADGKRAVAAVAPAVGSDRKRGDSLMGLKGAGSGSGCPVWHQPFQTNGPNCCFILPAPPALPGGGSVVFINLHKPLAEALRTACPAL